ncbi:hypothetical protein EMCRGX_G027493 [Ephydatia muelleri]
MSQQGAALQGYNNELIKCIEDLCAKRDELHRQILQEDEEKQKIQNDIRILTDRLAVINESLAKKIATRNDYDRTISETEAAYKKILESSQSLLHVLKREAGSLKEKTSRVTDSKPHGT